MRVFLTGASGFIGSAVTPELLQAGHSVLALARSQASADAVQAMGAEPYRGSLEDIDGLSNAAAECDAVLHLGFVHDFNNFLASTEIDRRAIRAMGMALEGSGKPLIVTSGSLVVQRTSGAATEQDPANPAFPRVSESAALAFVECGVRASIVRLPPSVHGDGDHAFVPYLIQLAREKGFSAYIGDGENRWPAVHRLDAAELYRLVLERGTAGACYHGIAEEGVPFRRIAELIGRRLNLPVRSIAPEEAAGHFGWMATFAAIDGPASSAWTQQQLGWKPQHADLLTDVDNERYFGVKHATA